MERSWLCWGQDCRVSVILFVPVNGTLLTMLCPAPQLGVKALTYSDLIQAQKEISAHNQQLREQSEQLQKDNSELRSQSLRLVCAGRGALLGAHTGVEDCPLAGPEVCSGPHLDPLLHALAGFCRAQPGLFPSCRGPLLSHWPLLHCLFVGGLSMLRTAQRAWPSLPLAIETSCLCAPSSGPGARS